MEAEDVKRLGSAINILSTEKLKAQKVSRVMMKSVTVVGIQVLQCVFDCIASKQISVRKSVCV